MKQVLILGNGKSRKEYTRYIDNWNHEIWVCNKAYLEYLDLPRIDRVGSVHPEMAEDALLCKEEHNLKYKIYCNNIDRFKDNEVIKFDNYRGWSTGSEMIQQAMLEGYTKVVLLGFDMGGPDVYQKEDLYGGNFYKQIKSIINQFGSHRLCYKNKFNNVIPELENLDKEIVDVKHKLKKIRMTPKDKRKINTDNRKVVLQYHRTKIAYAPQIISDCINKYSTKYRSINGSKIPDGLDLIHFHNKWVEVDKPSIIQYHSMPELTNIDFPNNSYCIAQYPALYKKEYQWKGLVRNIVDLDLPEYSYIEVKDKIKVAYTPSTTKCHAKYADKGYAETLPILQKLQKKYPDKFEFVCITGQPLEVAINAKRQANIIIDECKTGSYHRVTLEGLAMGKYVINYVQPEIEEMFLSMSRSDTLPYHSVHYTQLEKHLEDLITNNKMNYIINEGKKSWKWMRQYWHHKDIIREFEQIYDNNIGVDRTSFPELIKGKKVIFVCPSLILKGKKLGKWIDSFDIVVRTNNFFPVKPEFQLDYGSKCDILYVNNQFTRETKPFPAKKYGDNGLKWICYKGNIDKGNNEAYTKYLNTRSAIMVTKKINNMVDGALTGTILIQDILDNNPKEFYISGMNLYSGKILDWENQYLPGYLPSKVYADAVKKRESGYFNNKKLHNLQANKNFITNLYKQKKINFDETTAQSLGVELEKKIVIPKQRAEVIEYVNQDHLKNLSKEYEVLKDLIPRKVCIRNAKNAKIGLVDMCNYIKANIHHRKKIKMVEIGSYAGDSTEIFAKYFDEINCIDPWCGGYDQNDAASSSNMQAAENQFDEVMKKYDNIKKYRMLGSSATKFFEDESLSLIYIDGLHTYKGEKEDIENWLPKVKKGDWIAGHDYSQKWPGCIKAVNELQGKLGNDMIDFQTFKDTSWLIRIKK